MCQSDAEQMVIICRDEKCTTAVFPDAMISEFCHIHAAEYLNVSLAHLKTADWYRKIEMCVNVKMVFLEF